MRQVAKLVGSARPQVLVLLLAGLTAGACAERAPTAPGVASANRGTGAQADAARGEPRFRFSSIDVAGSTFTNAQGINAAGAVVGYYGTADGRFHGFVYRGGRFTTVDYPGAFYTDVRGIGPAGDLVGTFSGEQEELAAYHGYRMTVQGDFVPVHYPGHLYEILQRILPDGTIVGCRHDHDTGASMKGVVIAGDVDSEIAALASMDNGATPDRGVIVGNYMTGGHNAGYTLDHGTFTSFMVPGSSMTTAWDISPRGGIVGVFKNGSGFHGYVRTEAGFTTIDYPGALQTRVFGTNARGDLVGLYVAGGKQHGFMATRL